MENQKANEASIPLQSIEKGRFLIHLVIGSAIFNEILFWLADGSNLTRVLLTALIIFLIYEGYDWAKYVYAAFSGTGAIFWAVAAFLLIQAKADWVITLPIALIALSSFTRMIILFFSSDAHAFLETCKKQPKYPSYEAIKTPHPLPQHYELSEKVRLNSSIQLPTYEISTVLSIPSSTDHIILMKFIESFRNVFRCTSDGSLVWQAELPTASNDVYTNIEWKENQLTAFSRSCVFVVLDVESGQILLPKTATYR